MVEEDVISHLIDVERLASDLLLDAQTEADTRKASALERSETEYLLKYKNLVSRLELNYSNVIKKLDSDRDEEYKSYKLHLSSLTKDQSAFNAYLDSLFFGQ